MKQITHIILFFFLLVSTVLFSQRNKGSLEKIKALKTVFFTEKLDISPKEAQLFWPIYNLHSDKLHQLKMSYKQTLMAKYKTNGGIDNISEEEAKEMIDARLANEKKAYEQSALMLQELSTVISHKKIVKLQIAEYEFKRKLIGKLRGKRKNKQK